MKLSCALIAISLAVLSPTRVTAQSQSLPMSVQPLSSMDGFRTATANWQVAGSASASLDRNGAMSLKPGTGILVNTPSDGARDNLFTEWEHGDIELDLEFLMPRESNSGIYLQGRYEIQLFDSWGVRRPTFADAGGIYERWDSARPEGSQGYQGHAPRMGVSRAPGLWQQLHIQFQAPRFNVEGNKVANAKMVTVSLNGVVIHENVELTGPTRAAAFEDEAPMGPLMLQGDHGPVAFRNIRYKLYTPDRVSLADTRYGYAEGQFEDIPMGSILSATSGSVRGIDWRPATANEFAMGFSGTMAVPQTGRYRFLLQLDWVTGDPHDQASSIGAGRLTIGAQTVLEHDGRMPSVSGDVDLEAGTYPYTLRYFKNKGWGPRSVSLWVEGGGMPLHDLNAPGSLPDPPRVGAITVEPTAEPAVIRGFVRHGGSKKTHTVSVGDPQGVHYALDLAQGALLQVWKGHFIETTDMWHSRGTEQLALPLGSVVVLSGSPTVAVLPSQAAAWPDTMGADYTFRGYQLDDNGHPQFNYTVGDLTVTERLLPEQGGRELFREVTVGGPPDGKAWIRMASGVEMHAVSEGLFAVDDQSYYVVLHNLANASPVMRGTPAGLDLLVPVSLSNGPVSVRFGLVW